MNKITSRIFPALVLAACLATTSCMSDPYGSYQQATPVQKGALTGALAGAAIGGLAEGDLGGVAVGAAIGALAGGATGHVVSQQQHRRNAGYGNEFPGEQNPSPYPQGPPREGNGYDRPTPPPQSQSQPQSRTDQQNYPTAQRTNRPDRVLSPYPPHNTIDVEGFKSGDLAIDPTTEKIFKIP